MPAYVVVGRSSGPELLPLEGDRLTVGRGPSNDLALEADSKKVGTRGGELDFALLVDGLAAEREQGITIDVAYRFFSTDRRKFIVADTPGHEQYTRNMVTGASTADLAVILIDGRRLAELMIEHGIGVAEEHAYSVKKIDSDYFEES